MKNLTVKNKKKTLSGYYTEIFQLFLQRAFRTLIGREVCTPKSGNIFNETRIFTLQIVCQEEGVVQVPEPSSLSSRYRHRRGHYNFRKKKIKC